MGNQGTSHIDLDVFPHPDPIGMFRIQNKIVAEARTLPNLDAAPSMAPNAKCRFTGHEAGKMLQ
jgi:hypothetical protein